MNNEVETVDEIIKEMRECKGFWVNHNSCEENVVNIDYVRDFADRIEAAYKREMEAGMMCDMSCRESGSLLEQYMESEQKLFKENKELRKQLEKDEALLAGVLNQLEYRIAVIKAHMNDLDKYDSKENEFWHTLKDLKLDLTWLKKACGKDQKIREEWLKELEKMPKVTSM